MKIIVIVVKFGTDINDPKDKFYKDKIYSNNSKLVLYSIVLIKIKIIKNDENEKVIFKNYLCSKIDYDKKFLTINSNNTSWV